MPRRRGFESALLEGVPGWVRQFEPPKAGEPVPAFAQWRSDVREYCRLVSLSSSNWHAWVAVVQNIHRTGAFLRGELVTGRREKVKEMPEAHIG